MVLVFAGSSQVITEWKNTDVGIKYMLNGDEMTMLPGLTEGVHYLFIEKPVEGTTVTFRTSFSVTTDFGELLPVCDGDKIAANNEFNFDEAYLYQHIVTQKYYHITKGPDVTVYNFSTGVYTSVAGGKQSHEVFHNWKLGQLAAVPVDVCPMSSFDCLIKTGIRADIQFTELPA